MQPLADRIRPLRLQDFVGQQHLLGQGEALQKCIVQGHIPSLIFWGPPGSGKTTLAGIIAETLAIPMFQLSAIQSGVKELREIVQKAQMYNKVLLFIDEIHHFNKTQQDALLPAVEKGTVTLIGATTENPSFELIRPLLSRCQVYILEALSNEHLKNIIHRAIIEDEILASKKITIKEYDALLTLSDGDARKLLNLLELVCQEEEVCIDNESTMRIAQQKLAQYDKGGEQHYNIISAFIKSIRGSDPNAALYWLARMLEAGEDPLFIARRMLILASEDIGNANPNALMLAQSCFAAVQQIGYPECDLILAQTVIYLASSVKSNSTYTAIRAAQALVKRNIDNPVPLHLRNAPTALMKKLNYGKDYAYAHNFENNFVDIEFLPAEISGTTFYKPSNNSRENEIKNFLKSRWGKKYGYE